MLRAQNKIAPYSEKITHVAIDSSPFILLSLLHSRGAKCIGKKSVNTTTI